MSQKKHSFSFKRILSKIRAATFVSASVNTFNDNIKITDYSPLDDDNKFRKPSSFDDNNDEFSSPWSSDDYWKLVHDRFNELVEKYHLTDKQREELYNLIKQCHLSGKSVNFDVIETRASEMQLDSYNRSHQSTHRGIIHTEIDDDERDR